MIVDQRNQIQRFLRALGDVMIVAVGLIVTFSLLLSDYAQDKIGSMSQVVIVYAEISIAILMSFAITFWYIRTIADEILSPIIKKLETAHKSSLDDMNDNLKRAVKDLEEKNGSAIASLSKTEANLGSHVVRAAEITNNHGEYLNQSLSQREHNLDLIAGRFGSIAARLERAGEAILENGWFFAADAFRQRESDIVRREKDVKVYIVSDTLSFDTSTDLIRIVKENLKKGADYRYIVKVGLEAEKNFIRRNASDAQRELNDQGMTGKCGDVKFFEVNERDLILAFDYAIFAFDDCSVEHFSPRKEIYVALEGGSDPHAAPWMRLDGDSKKMVGRFIDNIAEDQWTA